MASLIERTAQKRKSKEKLKTEQLRRNGPSNSCCTSDQENVQSRRSNWRLLSNAALRSSDCPRIELEVTTDLCPLENGTDGHCPYFGRWRLWLTEQISQYTNTPGTGLIERVTGDVYEAVLSDGETAGGKRRGCVKERARQRNSSSCRDLTSLYSSEISTTTTTTTTTMRVSFTSSNVIDGVTLAESATWHTFWSLPLTSGLARFGIGMVIHDTYWCSFVVSEFNSNDEFKWRTVIRKKIWSPKIRL